MEGKEEIGHGVKGNEGFILQKVMPSSSVRLDNPSSGQLSGPTMVAPPSSHSQLGGPTMVAPPGSHSQLGSPTMVAPPSSHGQLGGPTMVAPPSSHGGQVANMSTPMSDLRKKRGRPRKYASDGSVSAALSPMPISASIPLAGGDFPGWKPKRPYQRKVKEHKLEIDDLGERLGCVVGANFTPHVLTVNAGEDVAMKILSFSQQDSRAICVLSACGSISNVTLRQPNSSGGTLTYEGRFEILSLSGSFMPTDNGIVKSRSGGMSVSLASPDGRVLGGGLAGLLVAASPVQVVVGSFLPGHPQEQKPRKSRAEPITTVMPTIISPVHEGGYGVQKVNFASAPTFHTGNFPSMNNTQDSRHVQNENNVSSLDGESDEDSDNEDDDSHSHLEISG